MCPFGPGTPTRNRSEITSKAEASLTFIDTDSTEHCARLKLIEKGVKRILVAAISRHLNGPTEPRRPQPGPAQGGSGVFSRRRCAWRLSTSGGSASAKVCICRHGIRIAQGQLNRHLPFHAARTSNCFLGNYYCVAVARKLPVAEFVGSQEASGDSALPHLVYLLSWALICCVKRGVWLGTASDTVTTQAGAFPDSSSLLL